MIENAGPAKRAAEPFRVPADRTRRMARAALGLAAGGFALCVLALTTRKGHEGFAFAYLLGFTFLWTIVLGSLFFVVLQHVTGSVWSVVIRRVGEMFAAPMGLVAVLFAPILVSATVAPRFPLFAWLDPHLPLLGHLFPSKKVYLSLPLFALRAVLFFAIWIAYSRYFVRLSLSQDAGGASVDATAARMRRASGPFMIVFAFTVTFAAFDWMMSLDPIWCSTIYGVYVFSGMVLAGLATTTLMVLWLRARGHLGGDLVTEEHLYSLGALIFAFACFWAYIAFSQFMLIWYGNLPEETAYYVRRLQTDWWSLSLLLAVVRFALPFALLLGRRAKMNARRLALVSVLVLVGQLLDLYWLIMPEQSPAGPAFAWQQIGPTVLMVGLLMWSLSRFLRARPTVATGDPLFEESRDFELRM